MRLAANGSRIKQQLGPHQRHAAGTLGEPLIPADTDADLGVAGLPDLEAGVTRVEVVLLVVAGAIGNMALAVDTQVAAVGVNDGNTVEARPPGQLEETDRQHDLKLPGQRLKVPDRRVVFNPRRELQVVRIGLLTEVRGFEQLLNQDDLRALGCRLTHQPFCLCEVGLTVPGTAHLGCGYGNGTGHDALLKVEFDKKPIFIDL